MKKINWIFGVRYFLVALLSTGCAGTLEKSEVGEYGRVTDNPFAVEPIFRIADHSSGPVITQSDPGTEDNAYGFEGGKAIKLSGVYYIFTTEMVDKPLWTTTRLGLWKSEDLVDWQRMGTLFESTGDFSGEDPRAALWSPMPTYSHRLGKWVLTYVAYNSKPNSDTAWYRNHNGKIWMAVSEVPGYGGLTGPYRDSMIILEPGADTDPWEGLMGTDSFYPFPAAVGWMAFYGSSPESVGLAEAPDLTGPWTRMTARNPVRKSIENPMVYRLADGRYVALFDGCGENRKIGYMVSPDAVDWSDEIFFELQDETTPWWGLTRTPLGLIQESEDLYTIFFTAYNKDFYTIPDVWKTNDDGVFDGYFASIGWFRVQLIR